MPTLPKAPTLEHFQKYVRHMEIERGFDDQTVIQKCLLLGEEVGELFKSIRKTSLMSTDQNSKIEDPDGELADIIIYLCSIANRLNINLESAFRQKETINQQRQWTEANMSNTKKSLLPSDQSIRGFQDTVR
jgi:NTP pyrophosphatase (non-canonical NTP hydrolase)